jgi:hypothetical protein
MEELSEKRKRGRYRRWETYEEKQRDRDDRRESERRDTGRIDKGWGLLDISVSIDL